MSIAISNPPFLYPVAKLPKAIASEPIIVKNRFPRLYGTYATNVWSAVPSSTDPSIVFSEPNQSINCTTNAGALRVFAYAPYDGLTSIGDKYIVAFNVTSISGTMTQNNFSVTGVSVTGTTTKNCTTTGRYAMVITATTAGQMTLRFGIGCSANDIAGLQITIEDIMVELINNNSTRTYPYPYTPPERSRALDKTYSAVVTSNIVGTETVGTATSFPKNRSVLVIGDSFTNDGYGSETSRGDFPYQMVRLEPRLAMCCYGVTGHTLSQIRAQLTTMQADSHYDSRLAGFKVCIAEGGLNDIIANATLASMQTEKIATFAEIRALGMVPVSINIAVYNGGTAGQKTAITDYNTWHDAYCVANGIPYYNIYGDSDDGTGNFKTIWASLDGIHPGVLWNGGAHIMAKRMIELLATVGGNSI